MPRQVESRLANPFAVLHVNDLLAARGRDTIVARCVRVKDVDAFDFDDRRKIGVATTDVVPSRVPRVHPNSEYETCEEITIRFM